MNNELQDHKKSDTVKWILTLVAFILVGIMIIGIICGWFDGAKKESDKQQTEQTQTGGLLVGESKGNGIALMSAVIPTSEYASYGISAQSESAVTLTATVQPDNTAENTGVDWAMKWKNASSSWATGKSVTDYVTLTPNGEGFMESKTVTLNNLQPFGEQIIVTATAQDNPQVTATCTLDYAQKVTDFSLSFGSVNCNFGGKTLVTVELNENGTPTGGIPSLTPTKTDVYTVATQMTAEYRLSIPDLTYDEENNRPNAKYWLTRYGDAYGVYSHAQFFSYTESGNYGSISYATIQNYSVAENGLYFGIPFMVQNMGLTFSSGGMGAFPTTTGNYTPASIIEMIEGPEQIEGNIIHYSNAAYDMFTLTVTVQSKVGDTVYASVTKETNFRMQNYTNISPVNAMSVDQSSVTF